MKRILIAGIFPALLAGCAHNAPVNIAPSYDVYSNYEEKVPGHYALYVEASDMSTVAEVKGMACSAHSYPVDASSQFETSVLKTFENLVESVEVVDRPMNAEDLVAGGYRAQLIVRVKDLDIDMNVIPGFWQNKIEADVEISASVEAINYEGKMLGSTIEGDGDAEREAGSFCDGGSQAVGDAMSIAMKETMERLGERLANATKLRAGAS